MGQGTPSRWRYAPILLIAAGLALAYAFDIRHYLSLDYLYESRAVLRRFVQGNMAASVAGFLLFYATAVAFVFPAPVILTLASGFLFGWWLGGLVAIAGATIGGSLLFLAARTAFGDVLRRKAGGAVQRFAEGFRRDAFTYLLVLRLTPVLPVAVVNIAPAFFGITLRTFAAATLLGIVPGAMTYAFLGSGLERALKLAGKRDELSIDDLLTPEMIVAFIGLTGLTVLGLLLKRYVLGAAPDGADGAVS